jgi:hypothetical protein
MERSDGRNWATGVVGYVRVHPAYLSEQSRSVTVDYGRGMRCSYIALDRGLCFALF